ncbi:1-phosphatidylinositol 4,5-bisphosphate phosphodiesterase gamma-1 [Trichonephila clavipes]|nr:1-phosphatidylinositol 4,5-bisphosphate phosphodiesterase gamma-1 [Trichonephila clavipes]
MGSKRGRPLLKTPLRLTERHFVKFISPTEKEKPARKCFICCRKRDSDGKKIRKETRCYCEKCDVGLCAVPCFEKFHSARYLLEFEDVDARRVGEIGFENFASLYHNLIHDEQLFSGTFGQYTTDGQRVTLQEFQNFLSEQQKDPDAMDEKKVSQFMREYLQDPFRDVHEPFFTVPEFLDFLFSKENDAWDSRHNAVNQDMNQPLVNYWIASSHNT